MGLLHRTVEVGRQIYLNPGDKVVNNGQVWALRLRHLQGRHGLVDPLPTRVLERKNRQIILRYGTVYQKLVKRRWAFWWPF